MDDEVTRQIERLSCSNPMERCLAARALGLAGPPAAAAVPALAETLGSPYWFVAATAAVALGRIGPAARSAVPALAQRLSHPQAGLRIVCAIALGEIGDIGDTAVRAVSRVAEHDPDPEVRRVASVAAVRCREASARAVLPSAPVPAGYRDKTS